jgi:hypothetical protein
MLGADYSWGRPRVDALKNAGVQFVGRYACANRPGINISKSEAAALRNAGINIGIFNEHEESYMMDGHDRGVAAAQGALAVTRAAGLPDGVVYFSVDFQTRPEHMQLIAEFLTGASEIVGMPNTGVYGSYFTCQWVLDNTLVRRTWQCVAWSGGKRETRADAVQDRYHWMLGGAECDGNTLLRTDGLRYQVAAAPASRPQPRAFPAANDVRAIQNAVHATPDGVWGPDTDRRLETIRQTRTLLSRAHPDLARAAQATLGMTGRRVDGIWGPATAAAWVRCVRVIQGALHVPMDGIWGPATDVAYITASPQR